MSKEGGHRGIYQPCHTVAVCDQKTLCIKAGIHVQLLVKGGTCCQETWFPNTMDSVSSRILITSQIFSRPFFSMHFAVPMAFAQLQFYCLFHLVAVTSVYNNDQSRNLIVFSFSISLLQFVLQPIHLPKTFENIIWTGK